ASYLVLDDGHEPQVGRYWDLRFVPDERRSEPDWLDGLRWHLEDAVRSHLVSDVPLGAFLSGGMDSSTVVALMARMGGPVRTFSIGFDEADFDELGHAREVARRYGTDHYELVVKPDALDVVPRLAWQFDEPFADASAVPTYYVSKITREHVTVALSGDGGDEVFAGYRRYAQAQALHDRFDRFPGVLLKPVLRGLAGLLPTGARGQGYLELLGDDPVGRYFRLVTHQREATLRRLLTPEARVRIDPGVSPREFRRLAAEAQAPDYIATMQYLDVHTYLPEDILTKVDRASMLVSLEARVPLLDHPLMEFVATMPTALKLRDGVGKPILRQAMAADLPAAILGRSKMGFGVPLGGWFRHELADYTHDTVLGPRARQRGIVDPRAVELLIEEHRAGDHDRSGQIWALLCLEQWCRQWLDRR
ncbi:MAG: asparagine synthetase B family protein, partial [Candidatus Rokuibacteriota bacterium]